MVDAFQSFHVVCLVDEVLDFCEEGAPREHNSLSMSPISVGWILESGPCTICTTKAMLV